MRARSSLRTIGGVLLVAAMVATPTVAAPAAHEDRAEWPGPSKRGGAEY